jgi:hypothetical protein
MLPFGFDLSSLLGLTLNCLTWYYVWSNNKPCSSHRSRATCCTVAIVLRTLTEVGLSSETIRLVGKLGKNGVPLGELAAQSQLLGALAPVLEYLRLLRLRSVCGKSWIRIFECMGCSSRAGASTLPPTVLRLLAAETRDVRSGFIRSSR